MLEDLWSRKGKMGDEGYSRIDHRTEDLAAPSIVEKDLLGREGGEFVSGALNGERLRSIR